jgi:hypothetical protein
MEIKIKRSVTYDYKMLYWWLDNYKKEKENKFVLDHQDQVHNTVEYLDTKHNRFEYTMNNSSERYSLILETRSLDIILSA